MSGRGIAGAVETFTGWMVIALIALLAFLALLGLVNAVLVIWRTLTSRSARHDEPAGDGAARHLLPVGLISMYSYLQLLADVLLVVVAVELIETLLAFLSRADPKEYLSGVIGAALVALARRVIVFFNPEAREVVHGEMYAYAALVAALGVAYALIRVYG